MADCRAGPWKQQDQGNIAELENKNCSVNQGDMKPAVRGSHWLNLDN